MRKMMKQLNIQTEKELFDIMDRHVDPYLRKLNVKFFTVEAFQKYMQDKEFDMESARTDTSGGIKLDEVMSGIKSIKSISKNDTTLPDDTFNNTRLKTDRGD